MLLQNLNTVINALATANREIAVVCEFAIAACHARFSLPTHQPMWMPALATVDSMPSNDGRRYSRLSRGTYQVSGMELAPQLISKRSAQFWVSSQS
jgi:hypothetical protein